MRNNDPIFWPSSQESHSLKQQMDKHYTDSINILQTQWTQADIDQRYVMGDQDVISQLYPSGQSQRKMFNFNLLNANIQMVSGYQRRNRKSTICIPVRNAEQKTADQLSKCLFYVHGKSGMYQTYSDAFEQGALTQGLGFLSIFKDMTNDPISGDIGMRYVDMKSVIYDPYFRRHDLSDCRFIWTRQFFDRTELAALYPKLSDDINSMGPGKFRDDKFYYMPEVYQLQFSNLIAFDEYWYLSTREATYLVDKETEETQEFLGNDEDLALIMKQFKNRLRIIKSSRPTTRRALLLNDKIVLDEENPYGIDSYPYVPVLGYFTPDSAYYGFKFKGIIRDARDAQYLFNRRKVADLDIVESQQQGLKIKKGALVTPTDSLNQGHGRVLVVNEKNQMSDVEKMHIDPPSPVLLQMEEMLQNVIGRVTGVTDHLMGQDIDDKAGIITQLRQSAGINGLTRLFDQMDEAQRLAGDIITRMIQKNWTFGKVRQIIGEEPTAEFDNKAFFDYGCKIVQGALTETQQQLQLQQLLYFRETTGINIPDKTIIEASTLQNKDKLIEDIDAVAQQAAEQAAEQRELELNRIQVDNATKIAYAQSQKGLAAERIAKIGLDKALNAERIQQAREDRSKSVLNIVEAIKNIQDIDLGLLERSLDILDRVKDRDSVENEEIVDDNSNVLENQDEVFPVEEIITTEV